MVGADDASAQSVSRGPGAEADLRTIVRLANHFGVSFWVARYRAKAARVITGPTRVRELDRLLRAAVAADPAAAVPGRPARHTLGAGE